jgi:hypothetical protein
MGDVAPLAMIATALVVAVLDVPLTMVVFAAVLHMYI